MACRDASSTPRALTKNVVWQLRTGSWCLWRGLCPWGSNTPYTPPCQVSLLSSGSKIGFEMIPLSQLKDPL